MRACCWTLDAVSPVLVSCRTGHTSGQYNLPAPRSSTKPVQIHKNRVKVAVVRGVLSSKAKNALTTPNSISSPKKTATTTIRHVLHAFTVLPWYLFLKFSSCCAATNYVSWSLCIWKDTNEDGRLILSEVMSDVAWWNLVRAWWLDMAGLRNAHIPPQGKRQLGMIPYLIDIQ